MPHESSLAQDNSIARASVGNASETSRDPPRRIVGGLRVRIVRMIQGLLMRVSLVLTILFMRMMR